MTYFGHVCIKDCVDPDVQASVTDHLALKTTFPAEGKTAFGEVSVAQQFPIIQLDFPYNVNTALVDLRQNGGSVTHSSRQAVVATSAAANKSAEFRSKKILKYNPGQGAMARFTAVFTTGAANSTQIIGIGNESDGFFFGYNGTSFGILHRKNGAPEIRTLTLTSASSTAENITVTLDSVAIATIAVTNSGNTTTTANEIAAGDYSAVGPGWSARAVGNKVEFKSWNAATHSGTFSITASTAAGTFAQNVVGTAPSNTWTAQASWNGADKFDGNGITGVTLVPTYGNVYQVKYQWLGYGLITFYVEDPDDGELHVVHSIEYANANTTPSLGDPSLHCLAHVANTSNTSDISIKTPCMAGFVEGTPQLLGVNKSVYSTKTDVTTSLRPIITVRQGYHFNSKAVQTFAKLMRLGVAAEHTKPINIVLIENGTLTGASFSDIDSNTTAMQYDTSASAISGGTTVLSIPIGKAGNALHSFVEDYFAFGVYPGRTLTVCGIAQSGTGGEATVGLELLERI